VGAAHTLDFLLCSVAVRQITLRINSQFLQIITDGAYSGELGTGLYVQADASPAATVRFDNFRIEAP